MAWHPLLSRESFEEIAKQRTEFLRRFVRQAPELFPAPPRRDEKDGRPPSAIPAQMAAAAALTNAAEIAFLSDRTSEGWKLVQSALDHIRAQPAEVWPTPRVALLGAVSRQVRTVLNHREILLFAAGTPPVHRGWKAEAGIADHTAGMLLAAALAFGRWSRNIDLLRAHPHDLDDAAALGFVTIAKAPEADLLPLFGFARDENGRIGRFPRENDQRELGWVAAVGRVQNYAARVRTLQMDHDRWMQLRPRAPLLDWTLLTLFLGLRRSQQPDVPNVLDELVSRCGRSGLVHDLAAFLRNLANEIDREADEGAPLEPLLDPPLRDYAEIPEYQEMS